MPYIHEEDREMLHNGDVPRTAGELNYKLALTVSNYVHTNGISYQTFNDVIGVLDLLSFELKRRYIAPYESVKIKENGEVFEYINEEFDKKELPHS